VAGWVPSWYTEKLPFFKVIYNAFIGAPLFGETALNAPVWTIQVELMGSILLFAMVGLFNKKPLYMLAWFLFFGNVLSFKLPNVLFYAAFLAGALLNLARPWLKAAPWAAYTLFAIGLVGLSFSLSPAFNFMRAMPLPNLQPDGPDFTTNPRLFWNTLGAIALVAGVIGAPLVGRMFSVRPLVHLGRISFSMYLLHMPLLMSVGLGVARIGKNHAMSYGEFSAIAFVTYVLSVIALAEIFCRYVDVPSIRLAARWSRPAAAKGREPTPEIVKSGIRAEPLTSQT
jgi:peptidoglycan/LPS O-acetylase OafA/YrhL